MASKIPSPAERARFLSRVLGYDRISGAQEIARERRRALMAEINGERAAQAVHHVGDFLAQLHPELVERVDPHQHRIGESTVFVERDQRAQPDQAEDHHLRATHSASLKQSQCY